MRQASDLRTLNLFPVLVLGVESKAFPVCCIPKCFEKKFGFETGSHTVTMLPRLGANIKSSCLSFPLCWDSRHVSPHPAGTLRASCHSVLTTLVGRKHSVPQVGTLRHRGVWKKGHDARILSSEFTTYIRALGSSADLASMLGHLL